MLGRVVAACFERSGWKVLRGARGRGTGDGFVEIDLDHPDSLRSVVSGSDLVVNTVMHRPMAAEMAVLENGGLLLNVAAPPRECRAAVYGSVPSSARGIVALNGGCVPGLSNLVAADLLRRNPDADVIEIVITFVAEGTSGRSAREWVHKYLTAEPNHGTFVVPLPSPYGRRTCLHIADEERGWLEQLSGDFQTRVGACFLERSVDTGLRTLNRLHLMTRIPRALFVDPPRFISTHAGEVSAEPSHDPIAYWVGCLREGRRLGANTIEGEGDYLMTAAAALALGERLLAKRDQGCPPGAYSIEELVSIDEVTSALERQGVRVIPRG